MSNAITRASFDRLKARLQSVKSEAKHATKLGVTSLVIVGGGAAAGAITAKFPMLPGTNVPTAAALGSALIAAAMTGMLEEQSDNAANLGAGMLAAIAARQTELMLKAA